MKTLTSSDVGATLAGGGRVNLARRSRSDIKPCDFANKITTGSAGPTSATFSCRFPAASLVAHSLVASHSQSVKAISRLLQSSGDSHND